MRSHRSARATRAFLKLVGLAVLVSGCQAEAQNNKKVESITDGIIAMTVQGDEFRSGSGYPNDSLGDGNDANAMQSWEARCQELEAELQAQLESTMSVFDCGTPRNISRRDDRVQYASESFTHTSAQRYWELDEDKIAGDFISAEDFSDEFKWQSSREVARESYHQACLAFKEDALQEYGQNLLFADCGAPTESNSKYGWQYTSLPTLMLLVEPVVTPAPVGCVNGRKEGEQWWSTSRKNPLREYGTCTWGGSKTNLYERQTLKVCRNGDIEVLQERRGPYLSSTGSCHAPPRNCGIYSNGDTWYEVRGYMDGSYRCSNFRSVPALYQRLAQYYCDNGSVRNIGSFIEGDLIRVIGRCERPHRPRPDRPHRPPPPHCRDRDGRGQDHRCRPTKPGPDKPTKPGPDKPTKPGPVKPKPGPDKPKPGPVKPKPGPDKPKPGPVKPKPGPVKPAPGPTKPRPGPAKPNPGPGRPKPDQPKPGPQQPKPGPKLPKPGKK